MPMEADASAPMLPTIDASMYCIMVVVSCARMAGVLSCSTSRACCPSVMGFFCRMSDSSWSLLSVLLICVMGFGAPPCGFRAVCVVMGKK